MTEVSELAVEARDGAGKGAARAVRRSGRVPAVIYGDNKAPISISIDRVELRHELKQPGFRRRLYDLRINGLAERVLPRDVQRHPVSDEPLHVDFLRIGAGAEISVNVAVVFVNEELSPGLKRGGVLNIVRHEIEVVCPATEIPESFIIDLEGLEIGDGVHISQVTLPENVVPTITDRDFTIATVAAPTVVRDEAAAEAEAEEEEEIEGEEAVEGEVAEEAAEEGPSGEQGEQE